ncbi:MAG: hypothetical protein LBJ07_04430 [Actinomycetes bacterium]|nr:hypothetical protein [Actinomycetes bacterium]
MNTMMNWISHNVASLIALSIITAVAVFSAFSLRRQKRLSGTICANCPHASECCKGIAPGETAPCHTSVVKNA